MQFKIKKNRENKVRTSLHYEDVEIQHLEALVSLKAVSIHYIPGVDGVKNSPVVVFTEPFSVPRFNRFFASKITGLDDPYLGELIKRLLYLNPCSSKETLMIKRITEFILMVFTVKDLRESEVSGKFIPMPVIQHEELAKIIKVYTQQGLEGYTPDNEDFVLFSRDLPVSKQGKIRLRAEIRSLAVARYCDKAIHTAAEMLIDRDKFLHVNPTRISDTKMVTLKDNPASLKTIRKYMSERTKRVMAEHNQWAPFKTENTYAKYNRFLELPPDSSILDICESLSISKSTALDFRKLRESFSWSDVD